MARSQHHRPIAVLVACTAGSLLAATPALATEAPNAPPPGPTLPAGIAPVTFAPVPAAPAPAARRARLISRARIVPRRVRRGGRTQLRVRLTTPSRLRIVLNGRAGHRLRVIRAPARGRTVALRVAARAKGHALRPGRYRISVTALDAQGVRSQPVRLTLVVRR